MLNLYAPSAHHHFHGQRLHFSNHIDDACEKIHKACKGLGTDEKLLTEILGPKSPEDRYLIAMRYKELFKTNLKDLIKSETSGDYGKLLYLICQPLPEAEAYLIRSSTKGMGTDEKVIFPIVVGRTNLEMKILKKTFFDMLGKDLGAAIDSDLDGDFKKVIMASLQEQMMDFNPSFHTHHQAERDAETLYKAGAGRMGTDEDTFIKIMVTSPPEHLRNINAAYSKKYNHTIVRAVESEFGGDAKKALLMLTRMVLEPLEFLAEHFENTMKGFGTDELGLSMAVVRYHCILPQIKETYRKMYKKDLRDRIHGETSGDYRTLLLKIVDSPQ